MYCTIRSNENLWPTIQLLDGWAQHKIYEQYKIRYAYEMQVDVHLWAHIWNAFIEHSKSENFSDSLSA